MNRFLIQMIEPLTKLDITKSWTVGWYNKWCREMISFRYGLIQGPPDIKRARFLFLGSACSMLTHFSQKLSPHGYQTAASSNSWAFSCQVQIQEKWASCLPQEFKSRAQKLSFFAPVLVHRADTVLGGGRVLSGSARALGSSGIDLPRGTRTELEECCSSSKIGALWPKEDS